MDKFRSGFEAYQWAQEILVPWRSGKGFDPDPEQFRGGMKGIGMTILLAIDIDHIAQKACQEGCPCRYYDKDCLLNWYLPPPTEKKQDRTDTHIRCIGVCVALFEKYLRMREYME